VVASIPWDFLLTARRDLAAARRFFEQAIDLHGEPEKITIDKSGANTAAVKSLIADSGLDIQPRQSKYLDNLIEQDHRAIKRRVRPMMGFGRFHTATKLIGRHRDHAHDQKGQLGCYPGRWGARHGCLPAASSPGNVQPS